MGGRAREFIDLPEERSIGGIIGNILFLLLMDVAGC